MIKEFLDPVKILKQLDLKENMVVADFGCGSGGWAIPLAKMLERGKVFAIDILEEPLSALRSKAKMERVFNIDALKANVEKGTTLISESCDLVLMTNLFFQVEDIKSVLKEGKRVLKRGGKILVVDWKEDVKVGPEKRVSPEKIKKIANEIGLKLKEECEVGVYHWSLIFEK